MVPDMKISREVDGVPFCRVFSYQNFIYGSNLPYELRI